MKRASHQTVRLSEGKHASPEEGACVMELASMLAGEKFSDHPRSVCRTIAGFLRAYNDRLDADRRQDLYAYAARVVGTAGSEQLELARAERLVQWADERREHSRWPMLTWLRCRGYRPGKKLDPEIAAGYAIHVISNVPDASHAVVLRLVDELIAMAPPDPIGRTADGATSSLGERPRPAPAEFTSARRVGSLSGPVPCAAPGVHGAPRRR